MSESKAEIDEQIERLQEQIAELIVENDMIANKFTNLSFDSNDVIVYLKKEVEDKDAEIGRLEEILSSERRDAEKITMKESIKYAVKEKEFENEIEKLKNEIAMTNMVLSNQKRLQLEMNELTETIKILEEKLRHQNRKLDQKESDERLLKITIMDEARKEMAEELELEIDNMRIQLDLERQAESVMNEKMIEHLEQELETAKMEVKRRVTTVEELMDTMNEIRDEKETILSENVKLRQMMEKSAFLTEKSLSDSKRRIEEGEKRRTKMTNEYNESILLLKKEIEDLKESKKSITMRNDLLEKRLLEEKTLREATVSVHHSQNAKVKELREFLSLVLDRPKSLSALHESLIDDVIGESRTAIFSQLSLIVSQIPIVK